MASSIRSKRLAREIPELRKKNANYFVSVSDEDLTSFHAYIVGPDDSCYAGKLVKLKVEIPTEYPMKPPKCTFIQHKGGRIHPNLYNEGGKVCLSILGTWQGPGWAMTMTIDTVLITIQSLLDSKPLMHEPGLQDSKPYNDYVRYSTWRWLLLDYINIEIDTLNKTFLETYLKEKGPRIWKQLQEDQKAMASVKSVSGTYKPQETEPVEWLSLENNIRDAIIKAGGNLFEPVGSGTVLSSDSLTTSTTMSISSNVLTALMTSGKRKWDALESRSARPDPAKIAATSERVYTQSKLIQNNKTSPLRQKQLGFIELLSDEDDEVPAKTNPAPSLSTTKKARNNGSSKTSKSQEVIVIDDD